MKNVFIDLGKAVSSRFRLATTSSTLQSTNNFVQDYDEPPEVPLKIQDAQGQQDVESGWDLRGGESFETPKQTSAYIRNAMPPSPPPKVSRISWLLSNVPKFFSSTRAAQGFNGSASSRNQLKTSSNENTEAWFPGPPKSPPAGSGAIRTSSTILVESKQEMIVPLSADYGLRMKQAAQEEALKRESARAIQVKERRNRRLKLAGILLAIGCLVCVVILIFMLA